MLREDKAVSIRFTYSHKQGGGELLNHPGRFLLGVLPLCSFHKTFLSTTASADLEVVAFTVCVVTNQ